MPKVYCSKVSHNPYKEEMITEVTEGIFLVDGYSIADRLLEGVMFEVTVDDNGITTVEVQEEDRDYFGQFNGEMFLKKVWEYAERLLEDGDEVEIPKRLQEKYFLNGINVSYVEP